MVADVVHDRFGPAAKRRLPRQQLIKQHAGREDVDAVIDLPAEVMLGRDVAGGAHQHIGARTVGRFNARNAEVGQLDAAIAHDDDVGRLDVAVPDRVVVREFQRIEQLRHDAHGVALVEVGAARQVFAQRIAFHVLHGDEGVLRVFAILVNGHDTGVVERAGRLRLAAKATGQVFRLLVVFDQFLADGLDGHQPLDDGVMRLVDDAHGALADHAGDRIFAQALGNVHGCRGYRRRATQVSCPASSWPGPCWFACGRWSAKACRSRRSRCA